MATRTALQIVEQVATNLGLLEQGTATSGAGAGATLVCATWPFLTADTDADSNAYKGCEMKVTSGTTNLGDLRGIITYVPSTGTFTPSAAFDAQITTETFDIFLKGIRYADFLRAVNAALRFFPGYKGVWPLTMVTDGDMETSGTTNWTTTNSTMTKVTGATTLYRGTQSGRVLNSVADGQVKSASSLVQPNRSYYLQATVRADVGTAELLAYDDTNSAEIASKTYAYRGWAQIQLSFNTPATCESLSVILRGQGASDDIYWDDVILQPVGADTLALPSWITKATQVSNVLTDTYHTFPEDVSAGKAAYSWKVVQDWGNPNSVFSLQLQSGLSQAVWIEAMRPFSELSADTDTCFAPRELIEAAATWKMAEWLVQRSPGEEAVAWRKEHAKWALKTTQLMREVYGPRRIELGFAEPPDTPVAIR